MAPVRIVHCADFHLDRPFRGLEPTTARTRALELLEAFHRTTELARQRAADLFLVAGDLFEHRWVLPETIRSVAGALECLNIPVFIAPGNHDPLVASSYYVTYRWPANVHIFGPAWESVSLPHLNAVVWGVGFDRWEVREQPLAGFRAAADAQTVQIGLMHGTAVLPGTRADEGVYAPFSPEQVAASGLDYLALGHFHCTGSVGDIAYYPGSPEGLDFGQQGDHGVLISEVSKGRVHTELVPVGLRRCVRAEVDISGCGTSEEVALRIRAAVPDEERRRHLYRVTLAGRHQRGFEIHPGELRAALQSEFYSLGITNAAAPDWDLDALATRHDLQGALVRQIRSAMSAATDEREYRRLEWACRLGLEAMEREVGGK